ncbi:MAG: NAD(P)/FAD-dependent oxidoreductase [Anaerolineales bacterium]
MNIEDVIIVGAGPGGLAAALQLERYGIKPILFEQARLGGLLNNANLVENYPGFPGGISGTELVNLFSDQVAAYQLNIKKSRLENLDYADGLFLGSTEGETIPSRVAVIASGTKPRKFTDLEIPKQVQHRVLYEIYPLLDERGKRIAIVGAGDAAFDYALNLGKNNQVYILNRGQVSSCLPLLKDRAGSIPNIEYHQETRISKINPLQNYLILLDCLSPTGPKTFTVDFLVGAIGRDPNLDFVSGHLMEKAIQLANSRQLYHVGDVANGLYRQTAIAVGDGILNAMKIYQYFQENV